MADWEVQTSTAKFTLALFPTISAREAASIRIGVRFVCIVGRLALCTFRERLCVSRRGRGRWHVSATPLSDQTSTICVQFVDCFAEVIPPLLKAHPCRLNAAAI